MTAGQTAVLSRHIWRPDSTLKTAVQAKDFTSKTPRQRLTGGSGGGPLAKGRGVGGGRTDWWV